jgi:hypothetical protein
MSLIFRRPLRVEGALLSMLYSARLRKSHDKDVMAGGHFFHLLMTVYSGLNERLRKLAFSLSGCVRKGKARSVVCTNRTEVGPCTMPVYVTEECLWLKTVRLSAKHSLEA